MRRQETLGGGPASTRVHMCGAKGPVLSHVKPGAQSAGERQPASGPASPTRGSVEPQPGSLGSDAPQPSSVRGEKQLQQFDIRTTQNGKKSGRIEEKRDIATPSVDRHPTGSVAHCAILRAVATPRRSALTAALLLALAASAGAAQPRPRTPNETLVPLDPAVRSMEVVEDGAVALAEPREGGARRGTIVVGARVPARRRVAGTGCPTGVWIEVGDDAYVCESSLAPSRALPGGVPQPAMEGSWRLPFAYAFVGFDGTRAYARPEDYAADEYLEAYGEGFGLALRGRATQAGTRFVVTRTGRYVPEDGLRFVRVSEFVGVSLAAGAPLDVAWISRERIVVRSAPRRGRELMRLSRLDRVRVLGEERGALHVAVSVQVADEGTPQEVLGYVGARDVVRARLSARPAEVGAEERWIDVDTATQTLVAYEGDRPAYATLVSTGRAGRATETPLGVHRIWVKLATSDMDDLEREDVERNYRIEAVPWVQFFEGSNGLHAAFWHDRFGTRHSHGCVNLSARDARALFDFTGPHLPPGWSAVLPTSRAPGTVVRVR